MNNTGIFRSSPEQRKEAVKRLKERDMTMVSDKEYYTNLLNEYFVFSRRPSPDSIRLDEVGSRKIIFRRTINNESS